MAGADSNLCAGIPQLVFKAGHVNVCFRDRTHPPFAQAFCGRTGPAQVLGAYPGFDPSWCLFRATGLGLYEYMTLAQELGAEPVWVVNSGNSHREDIPTSKIGPWVQVRVQDPESGR
jgi:hypothetical protein